MSAAASSTARSPSLPTARTHPLVPGAAFAGLIACAAFGAHALPGVGKFSPMILAIGIGILVRNLVGLPEGTASGIAFAQRRLLRIAIVLLGLQLTAAQVAEVGATGVAIIAATLVATFLVTTWLGRLLGVDAKLAQLIAAGTSICGASAVIATNTVTRGSDEDVAYAVACVTLFGSIAMFAYPLLPGLLSLDPHAYGLWSGASIHEVAQVVAAAFENGRQSGEFGTVAKLTRVMMLAPVVLTLGLLAARRAGGEAGAKAPTPWFVLGFVALVALNSLVEIPEGAKAVATTATTVLLTMALAAMGLSTNVSELRAKGVRPLLLGLGAFLFIALFSLTLVKLTG